MSALDDLAEVIKPAASFDYWPQEAARLVLAAGYTKPRTITTVEELYGLEFGTVIHDGDGNVAEKCSPLDTRKLWFITGELDGKAAHQLTLPATVLYEPQS